MDIVCGKRWRRLAKEAAAIAWKASNLEASLGVKKVKYLKILKNGLAASQCYMLHLPSLRKTKDNKTLHCLSDLHSAETDLMLVSPTSPQIFGRCPISSGSCHHCPFGWPNTNAIIGANHLRIGANERPEQHLTEIQAGISFPAEKCQCAYYKGASRQPRSHPATKPIMACNYTQPPALL